MKTKLTIFILAVTTSMFFFSCKECQECTDPDDETKVEICEGDNRDFYLHQITTYETAGYTCVKK